MSNLSSNVTLLPVANDRHERTGQFNLRTKTYTGLTVTDCLLQAKQELGADAIIVSRKTFKRGALFGRWGGRDMVEMTFGTYQTPAPPASSPNLRFAGGDRPVFDRLLTDKLTTDKLTTDRPATENLSDAEAARIQALEAKLATLTASVKDLSDGGGPAPKPKAARALPPFIPASLRAESAEAGQEAVARLVAAEPPPAAEPLHPAKPLPEPPAPRSRRRKEAPVEVAAAPEAGYTGLMQQLLDADIAAPLARQFLSEVPNGLAAADAAAFLRTVLSQRLKIAGGVDALPGGQGRMRLLAFVGTSGVGKTTTIAKLAARYALIERRKVGVITLDNQRIGAAEHLQRYGEILRVPVRVASDKVELTAQIDAYAAEGKEIILLDTPGRSPNEMIPLGETAHLFEGVEGLQKYLTVPAVLGQRDMDNIVTKFQSIFSPDAVILTKLDEASDHTCFGRLLTLQAKFGLPLAFVTTGQRVPDDILLPDAHAIASRILSSPLL